MINKAALRQQYNRVFDEPNLHKVLYLPGTKPDEKFSLEKIDQLTYTKSGRAPQLYFDSEFPNFGVRVHPSGKKTYFVRCAKNGKQIYQTLGRTGSMSLKEARSEAKRQLYAIRNNLSPAPPKGIFSKAKNNVPAAQPLPQVD